MSNSSHDPFLLFPCGHSICKKCVLQIMSNDDDANCPLCRHVVYFNLYRLIHMLLIIH